MAITAATPMTVGNGLLGLLRNVIPPRERAVELYRRLLAINELFCSVSSAKELDRVQSVMAAYFQTYFADDSVRFCIQEGSKYRKIRLSGPVVPKDEETIRIGEGFSGEVIKSAMPIWIPDALPSRKVRRFIRSKTERHPGSVLVLPITATGKVAGCLEMISQRPNRFDEIEYHLGLLLAANISSSLDNLLTRRDLAKVNAHLKDRDLRLVQLNSKLKQLAHTDECTGLFNKRRLLEQLEMEITRSRRYGDIFSCLMIDIDDFKAVNDTHGHQAGDDVLRQTGALLRQSLRISDFIARYGGEEFTVILPKTHSEGAKCVAENLRNRFMANDFVVAGKSLKITVSIGIASCADFDRMNARKIILLADTALYRAKRSGKNRACSADEFEAYKESGFCQIQKAV